MLSQANAADFQGWQLYHRLIGLWFGSRNSEQRQMGQTGTMVIATATQTGRLLWPSSSPRSFCQRHK